MREHRAFLSPLSEGKQQLSGDEAHHLARVLRVRAGQQLELFDGQGMVARATVQAVHKKHIDLDVALPEPSRKELPFHLHLAIALLKGDKLASVVRQASELGVI